jgi:hypothetical protein
LGEIEWFHRIRNNLYHEGNGITVDAEQLKTYRAIARVLFQNLFGIKLLGPPLGPTGAFLENWAELENRLKTAAMKYISKPHHRPPESLVRILVEKAVVDEEFERSFNDLHKTRNTIARGYSLGGMDAAYRKNKAHFFRRVTWRLAGLSSYGWG